ncbi:MAG TPA: nodulation protein NfeD [Chloroflexi bacterium]|nr:nodulation protein NfeD [Chloroflexota bacterium]
MKARYRILVLLFVLLSGVFPLSVRAADGPVVLLELDGVINPFSARYLERGLRLAEQRGAQVVIITLDTPGGLESAMREIVQLLLQAPLPTVVYVAPDGARATSAGMFVLLAADVAAMAPATHVGAAHPVPLGAEISDVMNEKMTSDAAALVRSVAATRGRNADWAERAVRENLSVTADEALDLNVIDLLADNLDDLLRRLDGRQVASASLQTAGAIVLAQPMNLSERFFHVITEPNIAYLLLSLGTLLLLAELSDPGLSVAGAGAVVSYIVAFMALGSLPVNWAAIGLLALSVVFFVVGLLTDTEAVVTVVGLVPFILGSLLLFSPFTPTSPATPVVRVSPWLIGVMAASMIAFSFLVLRAIIAAARRPPQAGAQRLIGRKGIAQTDLAPGGQVRVDFEDWSAVTTVGEIRAGDPVRVTGIAGVRLQVTPWEEDVADVPSYTEEG